MNGSRDTWHSCHGADYMNAGDYVELYAYNYDTLTRSGNANLEAFKVA